MVALVLGLAGLISVQARSGARSSLAKCAGRAQKHAGFSWAPTEGNLGSCTSV
jgi:hypothetical protein